MPSSRSSAASARVRPTTPCLAAQYAVSSAVPCRPEIDATLTIRPPRRARIAGRNARVTRIRPLEVGVRAPRPTSRPAARRGGARATMPALLTSTSGAPSRPSTSSAKRAARRRRARRRSETGRCPRRGLRAQPATRAPAPASAAATARPMPREAPVTTAVLPASVTSRALPAWPPRASASSGRGARASRRRRRW